MSQRSDRSKSPLKNTQPTVATAGAVDANDTYLPHSDSTDETQSRVIFTSAHSDHAIEMAQSEVGQSSATLTLAQSLHDIVLTRVGGADDTMANDLKIRPRKIHVQFKIAESTETNEFEFIVNADSASPSGSATTGSIRGRRWQGASDISAQLRCFDAYCLNTRIDISRTLSTNQSADASSTAAIIHRIRRARVTARPAAALENQIVSPEVSMLAAKFTSTTNADFITDEVTYGSATFSIDLSSAGLCLHGRLVATTNSDDTLVNACGQLSSTISATLRGNDRAGNLILRIGDKKSWVLLSSEAKDLVSAPGLPSMSPSPEHLAENTPADEPPTDSVISTTIDLPIDYQNPVTIAWQSDWHRPEIAARVKTWSQSKTMRAFLANIQSSLPTVIQALQSEQAPVETLFIMLLESHYFSHPGFPIEVSSAGAVGPWQFVLETALSPAFNLKAIPIMNGKVDACDERGDLEKSTHAAGRYFHQLFEKYKVDPHFALMAYNWGPGKVDRAADCFQDEACAAKKLASTNQLQRLNELRSSGVDFWSVKKFDMAPAGPLDYAMQFVAAQFVGRDPKRFGLEFSPNPARPEPHRCSR
jgi:hypothetical protein